MAAAPSEDIDSIIGIENAILYPLKTKRILDAPLIA